MPEHTPLPTQTQRNYYANTAADYDQMHLGDEEHSHALQHAISFLRQYNLTTVLDVGCGTGRGVKYFLDREFHAVGVEPVPELLKAGIADHNIPKDCMLQGSGESLPFEDLSFDASIELGVLHHVPQPELVVSEMIRTTRRMILLSDSNRFGQGRFVWRLIKLAAWKLRLWPCLDFVRTRGKGHTLSEEDGLAYSYSVYDSFDQLNAWADHIYVIPTVKATSRSWIHPLLTSSHVLLIAIRH